MKRLNRRLIISIIKANYLFHCVSFLCSIFFAATSSVYHDRIPAENYENMSQITIGNGHCLIIYRATDQQMSKSSRCRRTQKKRCNQTYDGMTLLIRAFKSLIMDCPWKQEGLDFESHVWILWTIKSSHKCVTHTRLKFSVLVDSIELRFKKSRIAWESLRFAMKATDPPKCQTKKALSSCIQMS